MTIVTWLCAWLARTPVPRQRRRRLLSADCLDARLVPSGAADHLLFAGGLDGGTAGNVNTTRGPPIEVAVQDAYGNPAIGTITVALAQNSANAVLGPNLSALTVAAVDGIATFSSLKVNRPGTGYTIVASIIGLPTATSDSFNMS